MGDNKKNEPKNIKPKKKKRKIFKAIYIILLLLIITCLAAGFGIMSGMIKTAPKLDLDTFLSNGETTFLYNNAGEEMDEYKTIEKRTSVNINTVPEDLKDAFTSIEDERFNKHKGIDIRRLGGAVIQDAKIILGLSDDAIQGASTITQQLIKYKFFLEESINDRVNIERKVQEIYLALQVEKLLSKDQILQAYMNTIFLGGNAHGIEAATNIYFNKSIGDGLTLKQCAFLASAAQNPTISYNNAYESFEKGEPFDSARTKLVLGKMLELGKITQEEYDVAIAEPLTLNFSTQESDKMTYEWFSRPVIKQVATDLIKTYGYTETEAYDKINYGGLRIYTTMDKNLQDSVQQVMNDYVSGYSGVQASGVITDYLNGEVKAIIGGVGDQPSMSYNRAISIGQDGQSFRRPPGSSIKPLTVYAPAIETKTLTAGSVLVDGPLLPEVSSKYQGYNPMNWNNAYDGYTTVRDAVRYSKNTIAVSIVDKIGLDTSAAYGEKFGLSITDVDKTSISALSLGQTDGTTPYEMAQAFGAFGNQGAMTNSRIYNKVTDKDGKVLLEPKLESTQVISPQTAYIIYDMLAGSVASTGSNAAFGNMEVRGKTGTTTDYRDLYFAGLTPYYSGAVWLGCDNNDLLPFTSSNMSAGLWGQIMKVAHEGLEYKSLQPPDGLTSAYISKDSGTLPTDLTKKDPRGNRIYSELFISGTQPTTLDNVHVELEVVKAADGKYYLPSDETPKDKLQKVIFITRDPRYTGAMADNKWLAPKDKDPTDYKAEEKSKKDAEEKAKKDAEEKEKEKDKDKDKDKPGDNTTNPPATGGDTTTPPTGDDTNKPPQPSPGAFNNLNSKSSLYGMISRAFTINIFG
ncbi:transglycosylase domain-containing protein [Clostridium sp.]|uniref:transglycosylase domain-containing protein n=1 Tax=Clostridium sp. TaxID=1506 RepID=UPI0032162B51